MGTGAGWGGRIRKGFPEVVATKLSPEEKAEIGQAKRWLTLCSENNICKGPEQKKAKRNHIEMNKPSSTSVPLHLSSSTYLCIHLLNVGAFIRPSLREDTAVLRVHQGMPRLMDLGC